MCVSFVPSSRGHPQAGGLCVRLREGMPQHREDFHQRAYKKSGEKQSDLACLGFALSDLQVQCALIKNT